MRQINNPLATEPITPPRRVLIVNKFYYPRGGDCICTINLEKMLGKQGYEVAIYAMNYPDNITCGYTKYFAPEVSFSSGVRSKISAIQRIFGIGNITNSFKKILTEFKPDIVHFQNIHSYLSPVVVRLAKEFGAKTIWTMHDYKLLCPSYSCRRPGNNNCTLCFSDKSNVTRFRCMKGSSTASILAKLEALYWNKEKLQHYTDAFICPSLFMKQKMQEGGFNEKKLFHICNFIDPIKYDLMKKIHMADRETYYCYVGRLSEEKGIETLLKAASTLPHTLKIAGDGPQKTVLEQKYNFKNIEFLGNLNAKEIVELLSKAQALVIPSEWFENNPLSVIESLCMGTPVIGARSGGIPELIDDSCGITFTPQNVIELRQTIQRIYSSNPFDFNYIAEKSRKKFSSETHFQSLIRLYHD